jgi:molybdopterin-guanine dinucleotide biosynthesis protein A
LLPPPGGDLAIAWDGTRRQPAHALLSRALLPDMLACLAAGERRLETWQAHHHPAIADFSDCPAAFLNLNLPQDIQRLESLLPATRAGFLAASQIAPERPSRPMSLP